MPSNDAAEKSAERARKTQQETQSRIAAGNKAIGSAFQSYTPGYYNSLKKKYTGVYMPQLSTQYDESKQNALFNAARAGIVDSSAAAKTNADLERTNGEQQQTILSGAENYANNARSQVNSQAAALRQENVASGGGFINGGSGPIAAPSLQALTPLANLFTNVAGVASNAANVAAFKNGANGVLTTPNQQQTPGVPAPAPARWNQGN